MAFKSAKQRKAVMAKLNSSSRNANTSCVQSSRFPESARIKLRYENENTRLRRKWENADTKEEKKAIAKKMRANYKVFENSYSRAVINDPLYKKNNSDVDVYNRDNALLNK